MKTGKQLKLIRIEKDIKAKDIAEKLGIHKSYISNMESGKEKIPDHIYKKWIQILERK